MRIDLQARMTGVLIAWLLVATSHADFPPIDIGFTLIADGLTQPLAVRHAGDGSGRLFVVERGGTIRIIDDGELLATPFLDISDDIDPTENEVGLLGLAFHPDYETNRTFFINFIEVQSGYPPPWLANTVIARYQAKASDPTVADKESEQVVLKIIQPGDNHNGGDIHFGPNDGYLYIGLGDGASDGDPGDRAQDPGSLLGKMLRIDVDNPGVNLDDACGLELNYGIPDNNPFFGTGDNTCDEIWALGFRNPFRFSFDADTGDLFIGDVGELAREEINFQPSSSTGGENYGWDCREGSLDYSGPPGGPAPSCANNPAGFIDPILEYGHDNEDAPCFSVTGGYRYRGPIDDAIGTYFYGDYCTGQIFAGTKSGGAWSSEALPGPYIDISGDELRMWISAFGEDENRNLYVVDYNGGRLFRIRDADSDGDGLSDVAEVNDTLTDRFDPDSDDDDIGDYLDVLLGNPANACEDKDVHVFSRTEVGEPLTCAAATSITVSPTPESRVTASGILHLIAPLIASESGFSVAGELTLTTADPCPNCYQCGNGVTEPAEECDDANTVDGDGCSAVCLAED